MNKKILGVGIVLIIIIGGALVWRNNIVKKQVAQVKNENQENNDQNQQKDGSNLDTSNWITKKNDAIDFSFLYPRNAKIIDEGNCYRVEYELGFAIFFLPMEGDMRCGARTGVGALPDNVDVTDSLIIAGEKYEAPGFNAMVDTKDEKFFNPKTRYLYDFHHMLDLNKGEDCGNAGKCMRVGYGIYKQVSDPLSEEDINNTMNILRAIIESVNFKNPQ
jgi:hypothetical protein